MSFRGDERAVSTVVGAVLIFAILILALGTYQSQIVPAQNERVEYEHSQTIANQFQDLRNAFLGTAATGNERPASVTLGVRYPTRTFTVNPPPPDGRLRGVAFENRSNITVSNVQATNPETADYLDGALNFSTDGIEYVPDYNEFRNAPTTRYEHGTLYDAYEEGDIERTQGIVVEDDVITLVTLNVSEEFGESGIGSVSVDPEALSAPYQSTQIENSNGNITLTLPTKANASMWQEVYEDADAATVTPNGSAVDITLDNGTYDLRMAHLGVGSGVARPGAEYLTLVRGNGTDRVTVEVRDKYNNPEPGVRVDVNSSDFEETSVRSDSDGQATFVYTGDSTEKVTFSIDGGGSDETEVTTTVGATGSGTGGDTGGVINPNRPDAVVLEDEVFDGNAVQVNLNNTGNGTKNVSSVRYNFYSEDTQGGSATNPPKYVVINNETLELRGPYTSIGNFSLASGDNSVAMCFYEDQATTSQYTVGAGDFYILSIQFDDGTAATYFVGPASGTVTESCGGSGSSGGSGGSTSASQTNLVSGSGGTFWGGPAGVSFAVENTGSDSVNVTNITVNSTSRGQVSQIWENQTGSYNRGQHEVYISPSSGTHGVLDMDGTPYYNDTGTALTLGSTEPMTEDATLDSGTTADVYLNAFRKSNDGKMDMAGETVTISFHFGDGSTATYSVST